MRPNRLVCLLGIASLMATLDACTKKSAPASDESAPTEHAAPSDTVRLSDETLKLFTIETVTVAHGTMDVTLPAPGRISFDLNRTARVSSTLEGRIVKMNYDVGATVHEGDVMVVIDSPEMLNRALELKAPMGGEVIGRDGTVGEIVEKAREIYTISDPTRVWVIAYVSTSDVAAVRAGQSASIRSSTDSNALYAGKVVLVSPEVDEKSGTVEVRIETNDAAALKPGTFVDVEIVTGAIGHVVVIPAEAVQRLGDQEIVFVQDGDHAFVKRPVTTGRNHDGRVQILEGLEDGVRVVSKGSFVLKSELLKNQLGE